MNLSAKARIQIAIVPILIVAGLGLRAAAAGRVATSNAPRELSLREICSSIRSALRSQGARESALPSLEQIRPAVPITVTVGDPGLQVLRMDADVAPGAIRARLWTGGEPAIHPFDVRILADRELSHWLAQRSDSARAALVFKAGAVAKPALHPRVPQPRAPKLPALVFPGQAATLLLEQPNMEVRTPVMPLARGVSGQWIRVRSLSTGQVLAAEVVGPGSLARQF